MARTFAAGTGDVIGCGIGANTFTTACSMAAIIRPTADGSIREFFVIGTSANTSWTLEFDASDRIVFGPRSARRVSTLTAKAVDGWVLVGGSRPAGANQTSRIHKYVFATGTFSHENCTATSSDLGAAPTTSVFLGSRGGSAEFTGDIATCGAWNADLTDQQFESLAFDLNAWFAVQPNGLWLLDQASTSMLVNDLTGNGANQTAITGTSVSTSSVPVFSYGHPIIIGEAGAAPVTVNLPTATLTLTPGDLTATPGAVSVPLPTAEIEIEGGTLTPTPGPVSITLPPALLALTAGALAVVPGGITVTLPSGTITLAPGVLTARIGDAVSVGCITLTLADTATASLTLADTGTASLTLADTAKATLTIEEC